MRIKNFHFLLVMFLFLVPIMTLFCQITANSIAEEDIAVYADIPRYSLLSGGVQYSKATGLIKRGSEFQLLQKSEIIGYVNLWWRVRYMKNGQAAEGWIPLVTKKKDNSILQGNLNITDPGMRESFNNRMREVKK